MEESVEGIDDSAADGIFDGDEAVIDMSADDFFEDGRNIRKRNVFDG